ncbi:MAG: hypothetical protein IJP07_04935 [Firmicutes bacterium]|nr:hypothetical protein [Bacillota bacterium]
MGQKTLLFSLLPGIKSTDPSVEVLWIPFFQERDGLQSFSPLLLISGEQAKKKCFLASSFKVRFKRTCEKKGSRGFSEKAGFAKIPSAQGGNFAFSGGET